MKDIDNLILESIKDEFKSITQIHKELCKAGVSVGRDVVRVHIKRMHKWGEVFCIIGQKGEKQGVVPLKYKKMPEF